MEEQGKGFMKRDGELQSLWQKNMSAANDVNSFNQDQIFDVIIIGGGITGVTLSFLLQSQGKKCLLVEAQNLGFGTSSGTTAHLNTFLDATYPQIDKDFGKDASKLMANAARRMIELIHSNISTLNIDADFDFKEGFLFSETEDQTKELLEILSSSREAGVEVDEVSESELTIPFEKVLCFKNQAQFHPIKYILGLAKEFQRLGGKISENTFIDDASRKDGIHYALSNGQTFKAKNLVYATHLPPGINLLSFTNAPYRSYVLGIKLQDDNYPQALIYDMQEPYHYIRTHELEGEKIMILGGADHKTGHEDPAKAFEELEDYARQHFNVKSVNYRWSSQYYVPVDGLPYIGQMPGGDENTFIATGYNGNGMILGSLAALIISDLILGHKNEYEDLLSPSRLKPIAGFTDFVKENADVVYHFVADRFNNQLLESTTQLKPGEGRIVKFDGDKVAISKDKSGKVNALSPLCTHAGCIVNWNAEEQSWDCPCHGGRFSCEGKVLTGPPRTDLKIVPLKNA